MEKKLEKLSDLLEQREAQISEVLAAAQLDPMAVINANQKLEVCIFFSFFFSLFYVYICYVFYVYIYLYKCFFLKNMLNKKNNAIQDLQYELAKVCKAHDDLLRSYETKLQEYGIPKSELGFQPLRVKAITTKLGLGPAGLVTSNH